MCRQAPTTVPGSPVSSLCPAFVFPPGAQPLERKECRPTTSPTVPSTGLRAGHHNTSVVNPSLTLPATLWPTTRHTAAPGHAGPAGWTAPPPQELGQGRRGQTQTWATRMDTQPPWLSHPGPQCELDGGGPASRPCACFPTRAFAHLTEPSPGSQRANQDTGTHPPSPVGPQHRPGTPNLRRSLFACCFHRSLESKTYRILEPEEPIPAPTSID